MTSQLQELGEVEILLATGSRVFYDSDPNKKQYAQRRPNTGGERELPRIIFR